MSNLSPRALALSHAHTDGAWEGVARPVEGMVPVWQRYRPGDVIAEFDAPVAAVDPKGHGRMTRSQFLNAGDRFCYLPPLPAPPAALEPTERLRSPGRQWRHVKRGTIYTEVVRAELQIAAIDVVEGSSMVVYRGEDGKLWVREETEFEDGRFEEIAPTPENTEVTRG